MSLFLKRQPPVGSVSQEGPSDCSYGYESVDLRGFEVRPPWILKYSELQAGEVGSRALPGGAGWVRDCFPAARAVAAIQYLEG